MRTWVNIPSQTQADFIERWEQALRVLLGLPVNERLCMHSWSSCLAGLCGRDPWFRERGFVIEEWPIAYGFKDFCYDGLSFPGYAPVNFFGSYGWNVVFLNARMNKDQTAEAVRGLLSYLGHGGDPFGEAFGESF